jgi:HELP motif
MAELSIFVKTCLERQSLMSGTEPPENEDVLKVSQKLMNKYDRMDSQEGRRKGSLNRTEWYLMFLEEKIVARMLYSFGLVSKLGGADDITEFDQYLDFESEKADGLDPRLEMIRMGMSGAIQQKIASKDGDDQDGQDAPDFAWKNDIDLLHDIDPEDVKNERKKRKINNNPPYCSLKLEHIFGVRSFDTRNNVKLTGRGGKESSIIYSQASLILIQ